MWVVAINSQRPLVCPTLSLAAPAQIRSVNLMIYHTIADILTANERAQAQFLAAVSNLNEAQSNFRPEQNQRTIAEMVENVSIVNDRFLRLTHKLLKEPESARRPSKAELNLGHTSLDENGQQHRGQFQGTDRVRPQGGARIDDSLAK